MDSLNQRLADIAANGLKRAGRSLSNRHGTPKGEVWTTAQREFAVSKINVDASKYPELLKLRLYCGTREVQNVLEAVAQEACAAAGITDATVSTPDTRDQDPACGLAVVVEITPERLGPGADPQLLGPEGWGSFVVSLVERAEGRVA